MELSTLARIITISFMAMDGYVKVPDRVLERVSRTKGITSKPKQKAGLNGYSQMELNMKVNFLKNR